MKLKKILLSPAVTILAFLLAVGLLLFSTVGGARAALTYFSETYASRIQLSDIGVTINRDGTLQLNESKLKAADLSKVQELFSSDNVMSYGSTVKSRLGFAGASSNTVQSAQKDDETKEDEVEYTGASGLKTDIQL